MGATGVALVVFAPGYDAMTWLSWVWPPVVAAMAVWMFVQVRRSVTGAGRWMLLPVVAVLGLASVGATYENIAERSDQGTYPAPGDELPGQRPPDAPGLPRPRRPHRRALQRHGRDLRHLGQDRRPGRPDHPGLRLRPPRTGLERRDHRTPKTE